MPKDVERLSPGDVVRSFVEITHVDGRAVPKSAFDERCPDSSPAEKILAGLLEALELAIRGAIAEPRTARSVTRQAAFETALGNLAYARDLLESQRADPAALALRLYETLIPFMQPDLDTANRQYFGALKGAVAPKRKRSPLHHRQIRAFAATLDPDLPDTVKATRIQRKFPKLRLGERQIRRILRTPKK